MIIYFPRVKRSQGEPASPRCRAIGRCRGAGANCRLCAVGSTFLRHHMSCYLLKRVQHYKSRVRLLPQCSLASATLHQCTRLPPPTWHNFDNMNIFHRPLCCEYSIYHKICIERNRNMDPHLFSGWVGPYCTSYTHLHMDVPCMLDLDRSLDSPRDQK